MSEVASFHLATFGYSRMVSRLLTIPAERWELAQTPGCRIGKVMGTSRADTTRISAEIRRWAILAIWENEQYRQAFFDTSSVLQRWRESAVALRHFSLRPIMCRGTWGGVVPFPSLVNEEEHLVEGKTAVLTRASINFRRWLRFARSVGAVDEALRSQSGCDFALGIGEWPIGEQATFSTWHSAESIDAFAYRSNAHSEVIRRTFQENWYNEMLFARFAITNEVAEKEPANDLRA